MSYHTVAAPCERQEIIKSSRFIAFVTPIDGADEAAACVAEVRAQHADANHNCWAFRAGEAQRFSDDGEPGGTAGRPMLEVLLRRELDYTLAVVTRYFGGTKLGAGGLVRAYSGSLSKALDEANVREVKPRVTLEIDLPFADMDGVHRLIGDWPGATKGESSYHPQGMRLELSLFEHDLDAFAQQLTELTRGAAQVSSQNGL